MHIGLFTDSYLPRRSGVVRAVEATARSLRRRGHRVSVFAPRYSGYADDDPDIHRFPSISPPRHPDFPLAVPFPGGHLHAIRELRLDLVHTHSPFLLGGVGLWAARASHRPVIFTYHTLYAEYVHYAPVFGEVTRPLVVAYTTAYCNRCDRVLASVPSLSARLRHYGVRTPVEIVPSAGIDPFEFEGVSAGRVREESGIPADAALLVFVGRLGKEKGVALLLDTMAALPSGVWLLIVGDGPERASLEASAARLGVAPRVVFAGSQDHARVVEALFAADVFVFPSQTETLGLVVLEAMAAGCAVVAVQAGAAADIIRDGESGRLVPPDPRAFAEAIRDVLGNAERRAAMAARARTVAAAYSQDKVTDRLIAAYEETIAHHGVLASQNA